MGGLVLPGASLVPSAGRSGLIIVRNARPRKPLPPRRGAERRPMARAPENPDRNFSANGEPEELERLKKEIEQSSPALPFNEAAQTRFGKVISEALLKTRRRAQ